MPFRTTSMLFWRAIWSATSRSLAAAASRLIVCSSDNSNSAPPIHPPIVTIHSPACDSRTTRSVSLFVLVLRDDGALVHGVFERRVISSRLIGVRDREVAHGFVEL